MDETTPELQEKKTATRTLPNMWLPICVLLCAVTAYLFYAMTQNEDLLGSDPIALGKRAKISIYTGEVESREIKTFVSAPVFDSEEDEQKTPEIEEVVEDEGPVYFGITKPTEGLMRLSLVITGLGLDERTTLEAMKLPNHIALSFSPYGGFLPIWFNRARNEHKTLLLDWPVQTEAFPDEDPGGIGLLLDLPEEDNIARINTLIEIGRDVATGLVAPQNESVIRHWGFVEPLLKRASSRKYLVVFPQKEENVFNGPRMRSNGVRSISAHYSAGDPPTKEQLNMAFIQAQQHAKEEGHAVLVLPAYEPTIKYVREWLKDTENQPFIWTPINDMFTRITEPESDEDELEMLRPEDIELTPQNSPDTDEQTEQEDTH